MKLSREPQEPEGSVGSNGTGSRVALFEAVLFPVAGGAPGPCEEVADEPDDGGADEEVPEPDGPDEAEGFAAPAGADDDTAPGDAALDDGSEGASDAGPMHPAARARTSRIANPRMVRDADGGLKAFPGRAYNGVTPPTSVASTLQEAPWWPELTELTTQPLGRSTSMEW